MQRYLSHSSPLPDLSRRDYARIGRTLVCSPSLPTFSRGEENAVSSAAPECFRTSVGHVRDVCDAGKTKQRRHYDPPENEHATLAAEGKRRIQPHYSLREHKLRNVAEAKLMEQRTTSESPARRLRRNCDSIAQWQQVDWDICNPLGLDGGLKGDDGTASNRRPVTELPAENLRDQLLAASFGGGAGTSMGLLRQIFKRFDYDGDGCISRAELAHGLRAHNVPINEKSLEGLYKSLDRDNDGMVNLQELAHAINGNGDQSPTVPLPEQASPIASAPPSDFHERPRPRKKNGIAHWQQVGYNILAHADDSRSQDDTKAKPQQIHHQSTTPLGRVREQLRAACNGAGAGASMGLLRSIFKHFDRDGDGEITRDELLNGLLAFGVHVDEEDMTRVLHELDLNADGSISLAEFASGITGGFQTEEQKSPLFRQNSAPRAMTIEDVRKKISLSTSLALLRSLLRRLCPNPQTTVGLDKLASELSRSLLVDVTEDELAILVPGRRVIPQDFLRLVFDYRTAS